MLTRVATGIQGLDWVTEGGLPKPAAVGLIGEHDSGKALLARQVSWNLLGRGFSVIYYSVDENAEDVRRSMEYYGWDISGHEAKGKFRFVDVFSHGAEVMRTSPDSFPSEYTEQVFNFGKFLRDGRDLCLKNMVGQDLLVVMDSIDPLVFLLDERKALHFLRAMKLITRAAQCIGIAILNIDSQNTSLEKPYRRIADVIIELHRTERKGTTSRYMRLSKAPWKFRDEPYPMEIIDKRGINIYSIALSSIAEAENDYTRA